MRARFRRPRRAPVKRRERATKKAAITQPEMQAMQATCEGNLEGLRARALLCFGFVSGGRRSEIAAADMRDLRNAAGQVHIEGLGPFNPLPFGKMYAQGKRHWKWA